MDDPYAHRLVKTYNHWGVYIHADQQFLGRCVIWCLREDAEDLAYASPEEQRELFTVLREVRSAIQKAFGATWFNYAFLGNVDRHLHAHLLPRYKEPVEFKGITFRDPDYNKNPWKASASTDTPDQLSEEVLQAIREQLKEVL